LENNLDANVFAQRVSRDSNLLAAPLESENNAEAHRIANVDAQKRFLKARETYLAKSRQLKREERQLRELFGKAAARDRE